MPTPEARTTAAPETEAAGMVDKALREAVGVAQANSGPLIYNGEIVPRGQAALIAAVTAQVLEVTVEPGDSVKAGEVLIRLDTTRLEAERAQALAELEAAQAQLDLLRLGADEADIEAARAAVAAADAAYKAALEGPTAQELAAAEAQVQQAETALKVAQTAYDQVSWNPLVATLPEARRLEQARQDRDAAQAAYDQLRAGADADAVAAAYADLADARARLRRLEEGVEPAQLRAAEAEVRRAETALYLAQLQLEQATVRAPIPGIVAQVTIAPGAMAQPGTPLAVVYSPQVEIVIPVEETRLAEVYVTQPAEIEVPAYPDEVFAAEVAIIAPEMDPATQTVSVTVRPTGDAARLVPGMMAIIRLLDQAP